MDAVESLAATGDPAVVFIDEIHALIARARTLREKTAAYQVTDDEFTQAKAAGRS